MIKKKINEKLNEKKRYYVCINKKGLWSVAVVTALSMLDDKNKDLNCIHGEYAVLYLTMDMKQKAAIEVALSDYLIQMDVDEDKPELKAVVYK